MKFYANPYDITAQGFYFESYEEYETKRDALRNSSCQPVEEFEIEVLDGTSEELELVNSIGIDQGNMKDVIEYIETSDESEWPALFFLMGNNIVKSFEDAKDKIDEVFITESSLIDAASELFDEVYGHSIPDNIKCYIDYKSFARDCAIGGDMQEFEFGGKTYTCTNANCI